MRSPDHFGFAEAEHALAGGIEGADDALLVHREHDVLDVIEDDLQMLGALRAHFVRHGARFVRHEAHRLHDAAALVVDRLVVLADDPQQRAEIQGPAAGPQVQLPQLGAKVVMEVGRLIARPQDRVRPDDRGRRRGRIQRALRKV